MADDSVGGDGSYVKKLPRRLQALYSDREREYGMCS